MINLKQKHKDAISKYLDKYSGKLKAELEGDWRAERDTRIKEFRDLLGKKNIDKLSSKDFTKIVKGLWASNIWVNKDYLVKKILDSSNINEIRTELKELIHGGSPISERFDRFKSKIKGLGPSSITEILVFMEPDKYCLWNDKPKNVLPFLGIDELLSEKVFKYPLNGEDYVKCNDLLKQIGEEIEKGGFKNIDFLDIDIFMWLLFIEEVKKLPKEKKKEQEKPGEEKVKIYVDKLTHWDVIGILTELGNLLGYDTYIADRSKKSEFMDKKLRDLAQLKEIPPFTYEKYLDTVKNVDAIWFKEEFPSMCFEVEHTTGVTLGLLRLYQLRNFTNVRFFVIAPSNIIAKYKVEISKDPFYKIKNRYNFRSYEELMKFYLEAKNYHEIKDAFLSKGDE